MREEVGSAGDADEPGGTFLSSTCSSKKISDSVIITDAARLAEYLPLKKEEIKSIDRVSKEYHMAVTPYYLTLIKDLSDRNDPVRKQCVPSEKELSVMPGEHEDPLSEVGSSPCPYLVHRYPDRVLLLVTGRCYMYCRHCTRKRLWKKDAKEPQSKDFEEAAKYIRSNPQIREVIISGGDPLTLSNSRLAYILNLISGIEHIEAIRIGTRTPVVFPKRIDDALCNILSRYDNLWINVQFNHPQEIVPESAEACRKLARCGIPLSNQSVLLKGVNDSVAVMAELCKRLQSIRVRPYYAYVCDHVIGTAHFWTTVAKAAEISAGLRGYIGGLCVPTFIVDSENGRGKIPVGPSYVVSDTEDGVTLRTYTGQEIFFNDKRGQNVK